MYVYLTPTDALIHEAAAHELSEARLAARRAMIISTTEEKKTEEKFTKEQQFHLTVNNQKLGLCAALLKLGNWAAASRLINMLPPYYATADARISRFLGNLIHIGIDKLYRANSGLSPVLQARLPPCEIPDMCAFQPVDTFDDLKNDVFGMISTLGAAMHNDSLLIAKLIRLGTSMLTKNDQHFKPYVLDMLEEAILPSMSLVVSNCGICEDLWSLLKKFPYGERYRLYAAWRSDNDNPIMIRTRASTLKRIKYLMKRLSKENVKVSGRQIGKLSHSNPSLIFDYVRVAHCRSASG